MKQTAMLLAALTLSTGCASLRLKIACEAKPPNALICSAETINDPPPTLRGTLSDDPHQPVTFHDNYITLRFP